MKLCIKAGSTSQSINVFIQDSSSTTGAGLTGLAFNTASLTAHYALPRSAPVAITLATLAAVTSAYSSGGFREIDATNMPGWYRLDIPDAALASGRFVNLHLKGAANMAPLPIEIELTGWDNQDAVRGGMSALPNAAAGAANGLPTCAVANRVLVQTRLQKNGSSGLRVPFQMTDSTNHNPAPGKTVTLTRSLNGAAFGGGTIGTVTEIANGWYYADFAQADINGDSVLVEANASGCDTTPIVLFMEP